MSGPAGAGPEGLTDALRKSLPEGARDFLGDMDRRYACKLFDPDRALGPALESYILECGRLSPSSFGLEPWRFIAVRNPELRARLRSACFDQDAVGTAAFIVTLLARRADAFEPHSDFVRSRAERFPGGWPVFNEDYRGYYGYLMDSGRLEHWARAQTYIAAANMMTGAAAAEVDSCAIEGFQEERVIATLDLDLGTWTVGLVAAFGYSAESRRGRIRESLHSILEMRD